LAASMVQKQLWAASNSASSCVLTLVRVLTDLTAGRLVYNGRSEGSQMIGQQLINFGFPIVIFLIYISA